MHLQYWPFPETISKGRWKPSTAKSMPLIADQFGYLFYVLVGSGFCNRLIDLLKALVANDGECRSDAPSGQ
ncbi:MAG: hypothetical protein D6753_03195 [Planctomycetota bacterium]|nr:MAG: hypothetical protein D6753_03195 [Planctomycetota bacterium]